MSDFTRLNVVLRPSSDVAEAVIVLSKGIAATHDAYFVLDGEHFFPHVTIYSPEYPKAERSNVLAGVATTAKETSKLTLKYAGITSKQRYVGLRMELTDGMQDLHEVLVGKLNPLRGGHLREGYREDASDYRMRFTDEQKKNIKKWGYPGAMALYHPHMTVIRLKDEAEAKRVAEKLSWSIDPFVFTQLGVYSMGAHGTCTKELAVFDLQ